MQAENQVIARWAELAQEMIQIDHIDPMTVTGASMATAIRLRAMCFGEREAAQDLILLGQHLLAELDAQNRANAH